MVAEAARKYLGVEFLHQGHTERGLDCRGLLMVVLARDLKLIKYDANDPDYFIYSREPSADKLRKLLERHLTPINASGARTGDILILKGAPERREEQHLAIVSDDTQTPVKIIHASSWFNKVVEHDVDPMWARMVVGAFRVPGVTNG